MIELLYAIFALLSGTGVFLVGCKILSENTEKLANTKLRQMLYKTSKSKLAGVGIGTCVTAIIQSSAVTTVMVVGLVNAGVMSLFQATTIIIGANIGTTITGQIAALQSFSFSKIAVAFAGIGIFINIFSRKDRIKTIGYILAALGLIFVVLELMSDSMTIVKESSEIVTVFSKLTNPFLLFFIGIAFTALIQSSSAVTSIIISMAAAGIVIGNGGNDTLYVILGTNIGTCVTALLSSVGAGVNAKRASIIHLLFNVFGSIIFFIVLLSWKSFMDVTFGRWFSHPTTQIAMFHTFFNVVCAMIFLPFSNLLVKISKIIIHDKEEHNKITYIDKRLLATPTIALDSAVKETVLMLDMAIVSLTNSLEGFLNRDETFIEKVKLRNQSIDTLGKEITNYLIQISSKNLTIRGEKVISSLHDGISDIGRISELADNITKYTDREIKENLIFSQTVKEQILIMQDLIVKMYDSVKELVLHKKEELIGTVDSLEDKIDEMRKDLIKGHIERLNKGECRAESSSVFINLANNLERVGDHLSYIAHSTDSLLK